MSENSPTWSSELYSILLHPSELRVLMMWGAAGWSLPHMSLDRAVWEADVGKVSEAMRLALGVEVTTLRYASYSVSEDAHQIDSIYVLESHDPEWEPQDGAEWVGRAALADLPLARPEHRALVAAHLAEAESGQIPELRPPWARVGWFEQAVVWMRSELERLGYSLTAPVEQVKSWGISCILRAHTASGDVYFKAASSLPLFVHEPAGVGDLLAIGCLDRRLERLAAQVDPLLEDTATLASQLDAAEIERLRALGPQLQAICAELASYAVPHTLVHGDLHLGNVARSAGRYLFFDWTDACVAHPFFDTISIFRAKDPNVQARLRNSYLGVWAAYEPIERLLEAWRLANPLCALHQAVSYQHIIATLEDTSKPELASGLPYWLRP